MVRNYKKKTGGRKYKSHSEDDLKKAVAEVRSGRISQKAATETVGRTTILNR